MATIGVQWGNIPNPWGQAYSVGSSLASDSNTAAINQARTAGYLESLGHTNALHDQQRELYGAKTETERQAIEGRRKASDAARALAESNANPAGASPAPVDPRAKMWGDLAAGSQLQSNSAMDAAGAGLKTTGGAGVMLNNDPTQVRKNMTLLGQSPNDNTVVGANDTVYQENENLKSQNRIAEEKAKPNIKTLGNGLVSVSPNDDGTYSSTDVAGAENTQARGAFNDSDKGAARNILANRDNYSPEEVKLAEQALAGSDGGGDPMYSGGFDSKTVDGQARNFINNYNDIPEDDPRRNDPAIMRRYAEAIDIVRGKSDHWSNVNGQDRHVVEKGPLPPNAVAPSNMPEDKPIINTYGDKKPVELNEWQAKAGVYGSQMALNGAAFDKITPKDIPGALKQYLMNNQFNEDGAVISLQGLSPAQQRYVQAAVAYLVPEARFESGATVLKGEYIRKWLAEVPLAGDDATELSNKRSRRVLAINNLADTLPAGHPMKERIMNIIGANGLTPDQIQPIQLNSQPTAASPSAGIDPKAIEMLKADPNTAAQFDEIFGQGSAAKVLGNGR